MFSGSTLVLSVFCCVYVCWCWMCYALFIGDCGVLVRLGMNSVLCVFGGLFWCFGDIFKLGLSLRLTHIFLDTIRYNRYKNRYDQKRYRSCGVLGPTV